MDTSLIGSYLGVKNEYNNIDDRISFSIEIIKCDKSIDESCKDDDEIENALKELYFTGYYIEDDAHLSEGANIGGKPTVTFDKFHSQF